jgi:AcrR family transcriptional regulator
MTPERADGEVAARSPRAPQRAKVEQRRDQIIDVAMRHFAEHGYQRTRIEEIAREAGVAKGSVFQYFDSKAGLFVECYKRASESLPSFLDAPPSVRARGLFAIVRYWLERSEHLLTDASTAYSVMLVGDYDTDLAIKRELTRYRRESDPGQARRLVEEAIQKGELRDDVEPALLSSILEWLLYRFQDALLREELDPGLVGHDGALEERARDQMDQFLAVLESAIGRPGAKRS